MRASPEGVSAHAGARTPSLAKLVTGGALAACILLAGVAAGAASEAGAGASTWSESRGVPDVPGPARQPSATADPQDGVHACWVVEATSFDGSPVSADLRYGPVDRPGKPSIAIARGVSRTILQPQCVASSETSASFAWTAFHEDGSTDVWHAHMLNGTPTRPWKLSSPGTDAWGARLGIDASGASYVVWQAQRGDDVDIMLTVIAPSGEILLDKTVVLRDAENPDVSVGEDGSVRIVARRHQGLPGLVLALLERAGAEPSLVELGSAAEGVQELPRITAGRFGHLFVTYETSRTTPDGAQHERSLGHVVLDETGNVLRGPSPLVSPSTFLLPRHEAESLPNGGFAISWMEQHAEGAPVLKVARVPGAAVAEPVLVDEPVPLLPASGGPVGPAALAAKRSGAITGVWEERRSEGATLAWSETSRPPDQVGSLRIAETASRRVLLRWEPLIQDTVTYEVYRSAGAQNSFRKVGQTVGTSYLDEWLVDGMTYLYRVGAVDKVGSKGQWSDPINVTPQRPNQPPILKIAPFNPLSGPPGTEFQATVYYEDPDGDPPTFVNIVVNGRIHGFPVAPLDPTTARGGIVLTKSLVLPAGETSFYVEASDGSVVTRVPPEPATFLQGPSVQPTGWEQWKAQLFSGDAGAIMILFGFVSTVITAAYGLWKFFGRRVWK